MFFNTPEQETTMEKQTPETLNLARDEKQEGHLAQISTTAAVAVTIEAGIARQPIQPPEPEPGPTPPQSRNQK
jgi:hypothetical protein